MPENLYIRWDADQDDKGTRRPPPDGTWWASPSVEMVKVDPVTHEPISYGSIAEADAENQYIRVRVDSLSKTPQDVTVQAWVRSFGPSGPWIANGTQGLLESRNPFDGSALQAWLGDPSDPSHLPHPAYAYFRWSPKPEDIADPKNPNDTTKEVHACLLANCYTPSGPTLEGAYVTSGELVRPIPDQHQAQRNITLRKVTRLMPKLRMPIAVSNPLPDGEQDFDLEIKRIPPVVLEQMDVRALALDRQIAAGRLLVPHEGAVAALARPELALLRPGRDVPDFDLELDRQHRRNLRLRLAPKRHRNLALNVRFEKRPKPGLHRFDVIQRGRRGVVGAATVLVLVSDDDGPDWR